MKSLLIIDTPKTCKECRCQLMLVCVPVDEDIDEYIDPNKAKPNWCPLRPLSEKKEVHYTDPMFGEVTNLTNIGYNQCLAEITGETK